MRHAHSTAVPEPDVCVWRSARNDELFRTVHLHEPDGELERSGRDGAELSRQSRRLPEHRQP